MQHELIAFGGSHGLAQGGWDDETAFVAKVDASLDEGLGKLKNDRSLGFGLLGHWEKSSLGAAMLILCHSRMQVGMKICNARRTSLPGLKVETWGTQIADGG